MPFSQDLKARIFVGCDRRCCLCYKRCGTNIEAAHIIAEADGGPNTDDNAIPLCFDCHQEIGSYNDRQPRGNKFTEHELKARRDRLYQWIASGRFIEESMGRKAPVTDGSDGRRPFTLDLGYDAPQAGAPKFVFGPLTITHLAAGAKVRITNGHPADHELDSPTISVLGGDQFRGEFYVDWDWFVSGETDSCVCSGYFHKGYLAQGCHDLQCGAELWINPGRANYLIIRQQRGDLEQQKQAALEETERLWGRPIEIDGWEESPRSREIRCETSVQTRR